MTDNCNVVDFTREHFMAVYQAVVDNGARDMMLIQMGNRLIQMGLANENEVAVWKEALAS